MKQNKPLFYILALVLLGMVCLAYWNHFNNPFHFDDEHTIVSNNYIRDIKNIPLFFTDATTFSSLPSNQSYRPGTTMLNAIDCWIGGKGQPVSLYYHISIFISFLLLGIFIYLFSLKVYNTAFKHTLNPYIALLTSGVFMVHTANAETINYIISRTDSGSTLFIVISLCVFVYYEKWRKYMIYLIPMLFGFFIKEPAVMVAPLAFLYLFLFEENLGLNKVFNLGSSFKVLMKTLPAFIFALILFIVSQKMTPTTWTPGGTNRWHYILTETFVMVHYVNSYFFPFNLSADTDWGLITSPFDDRVVIGVLFILSTLYIAYKTSLNAKSRPVTYGILWFYLALAPTSSVIPFSEVLNDHRVFFPYIGLTMALVWGLFLLYTKYESAISKNVIYKGAILGMITLFLAAHVYGVRERCKVWSSDETLWKDVTIKSPKNGRGLMNYGNVMMGRGKYPEALDYFTRAKTEWPYYSYIYVNLGVLNKAMGKYDEAETNFKYALQLNSGNPNCYFYYANMLKQNGRISEAKGLIQRGLALSPKHVDLTNLSNELSSNPIYAGAIKDKLELLENTVKQQPTPENYLNLSLEYYYNARYQDCAKAAEEAVKLKPDYALGYNNICSAYNMLHEWDKAIAAGKKAVELSPDYQLAKNNLQVALDGKKNAK